MDEETKGGQIAPGEDAAYSPVDEPYYGFAYNEHIGYPLNGSFHQGLVWGRF